MWRTNAKEKYFFLVNKKTKFRWHDVENVILSWHQRYTARNTFVTFCEITIIKMYLQVAHTFKEYNTGRVLIHLCVHTDGHKKRKEIRKKKKTAATEDDLSEKLTRGGVRKNVEWQLCSFALNLVVLYVTGTFDHRAYNNSIYFYIYVNVYIFLTAVVLVIARVGDRHGSGKRENTQPQSVFSKVSVSKVKYRHNS